MNQTVDSRKYYPTALALYITYFVLGVAATIMGQYKQNVAALWGASTLTDGSYDVSGGAYTTSVTTSSGRKQLWSVMTLRSTSGAMPTRVALERMSQRRMVL